MTSPVFAGCDYLTITSRFLTIGVSVCIKGKKLIYTWMSDVREINLLLILVRIGLFSTVKLVYNGMSCGLVGRSCVYFGRLCMSFGYVCVGWSCCVSVGRVTCVSVDRSITKEPTWCVCYSLCTISVVVVIVAIESASNTTYSQS